MSLGLCNRVCRHCKALFWFEERLTHRSARFPEYHKCCMGGKVVLRPQGTKALKVHTTLLVDVSVQGTVAGFLKQSANFNKERYFTWAYIQQDVCSFSFHSKSPKTD